MLNAESRTVLRWVRYSVPNSLVIQPASGSPSFFCLGSIYLVFGWLPAMLTAQGLDLATASSGLAVYNFGGVLGVLLWAVLVTTLGSRGPMLFGALACAASALVLVLVPIQTHGDRTLLMRVSSSTASWRTPSRRRCMRWQHTSTLQASGQPEWRTRPRRPGWRNPEFALRRGYHSCRSSNILVCSGDRDGMRLRGLAWVRSHFRHWEVRYRERPFDESAGQRLT